MANEDLETLFRDWVGQHGATVWKVARAYTRTAADCQDLVQEILLQVWRSLPQFEGRASAATWSYRVALNTALSWQRKERRWQARQQSFFNIDEAAAKCGNGSASPGSQELVDRLYEAIRQLPKNDAALVLLYLDELSYREMADILGISESNVGVKLNRAKNALSHLMRGPNER